MSGLNKFSTSKLILLLFIVALIARLVIFSGLFFNFGPGSFYLANNGSSLVDNDSQNYVTIAKNIVESGVYSRFIEPPLEPDSFRTPLMAFYYVPFVFLLGFSSIWLAVLVMNVLLSATAILAYFLAKLFFKKKYAFWVGLLVALEPLLAYRANIAEPDALIVLLFLAAMYNFILFWREGRPRYFYYSAAFLGVMTLAKPVGVLLILAFIAASLGRLYFRRITFSKLIPHLLFGFIIFSLILSPWLIRNKQTFGVFGLSSVSAYNFYNYYTDDIRLEDEKLPEAFAQSRDPSRDLSNQSYLYSTSFARIKNQPEIYLKQHLLGTARNLFASDLAVLRHHGHQSLLPVGYSPVNETNLSDLALGGEYKNLLKSVFSSENLGVLLRHAGFLVFYLIILVAWIKSYRKNKETFFLFTFFLVLTFYFVFTPGTFVDAKYRLPAVPLLLIVFFYFFSERSKQKLINRNQQE